MVDTNLSFAIIFAENCMKVLKNWTERRAHVSLTPVPVHQPVISNRSFLEIIFFCQIVKGVIKNCLDCFLPPAMKLRQGNVFTPVCHSVQFGGRGMHARGACVLGGMHAGECVFPGRVHGEGGMHGEVVMCGKSGGGHA